MAPGIARDSPHMSPTPASQSPGRVLEDEIIPARAPWDHVLRRGERLRIIDVEGNQSGDFLMYALHDDSERYSAQDTIAAQGNIFLRQGTVLLSNEGNEMAVITATTVARHDTIGGACSCESNTLRYGHHTKAQHACVENFLDSHARHGRGKRDMVSNINWFMNVPVEADGTLGIVDGISGPGKRVAFRAEMDMLVLVSNCPQLNNPCNDFNPTPLRMIVTAGPA